MSRAGAPPTPMDVLDITSLADGPSRLGRALALLQQDPARIETADLVGLIRARLVAERRRGFVPAGDPWPTPEDWRTVSIVAAPLNGGLQLQAESWRPSWYDSGDPPDLAPAAARVRRPMSAVTGDPFLPTVGGYHDYRTPGQREALRAVLATPPGRTVVAVLPTGSGKTLAVTGPARLANAAHGGQTLLVVPTVALALDMERRLHGETDSSLPLAYHGGLAPEAKNAFRERLKTGEQWLVVTSPEAVCTSLARPLEDVARAGKLAYFAIDEAHVVTEWGDDFRPAFQALAGVRRRLLHAALSAGQARFRTVALSGTLDDHGLRTLRRFFAEDEPILVAAQSTRPEPAYWHEHCATEEVKRERLLEAVRHFPKPLLVYATLKTSVKSTNTGDVERWLREAGFTRLLRVDGGSSAATRQQAVKGLRMAGEPAGDLDVVVANSAFGLGVDIDDIRAVIHVCMPETIDRFYQEVGRGGRDGTASASLLLWTDADALVARDMSRTSAIGDELAWKRWSSMRGSPTLPNGHRQVSLTAFHDGVNHPGSEANRMWNLHTLTTMERAGMIQLHWPSPPEFDPDADDDEMRQVFEEYTTAVEVEIRQGDIGREAVFRPRFRHARGSGIAHAAATLASMEELLEDPGTCVNRRFASLYGLTTSGGDRFLVDEHCGGCPACRGAHRRPGMPVVTPAFPPPTGKPRLESALEDLLEGRPASIWYEATGAVPWRDLGAVIRRLVEQGIRHLVLPAGAPEQVTKQALEASPDRWVCRTDLARWADAVANSQLATLVVLPPETTPILGEAVKWRLRSLPAAIAVLPRDLRDSPDDRMFLREALHPSFSVDSALRRL
jgi:ATP-dependent DNA helicase RecQ